ncbi:MAG TPA: hypothetical protein VGK97_00085, partial [Spongiibacteraceae bacterium]
MNELPLINPELIEPAPPRPQLEFAAQPTRSFWRTLLSRLSRDKRAMIALLIIIALVFAALFGPLLWPVDPAQQILGAAAQGPMRAQRAQLVRVAFDQPIVGASSEKLLPARQLSAVRDLKIIEANTEMVKLRWIALDGAYAYRIYRGTHAPRDRTDLGLPLGSTITKGQISFTDGLLLRQREYFYSVVASDGTDESGAFATIAITPKPAISWLEAQLQGLIAIDADAEHAPQTVLLPAHPLGTDHLGRDLLARLLQGARVSLFIAVSAAFLYVAFGLIYGAIAGFSGGRIDHWMMRVADFVVALPFLLFMILLRIAFGIGPGESGIVPLVIAL